MNCTLFIETILRHYADINECLPNKFLVKCWEGAINPKNMDSKTANKLLKLCSPKTLIQLIDILKIETVRFK